MERVVILGGGPAGIAAAHFLKRAGYDGITLVERDRIGGCARTAFYENIPYEFGPQIMFTNRNDLRAVFECWLDQNAPPSSDGKYHYVVSVNGGLDDPHTFPITPENVLKLPNAAEVIWELYNTNLAQPDHSNFENYAISRLGKTLYETYVKNYNRKAWQMEPKDMDTDWVEFRPLSMKQGSARFADQWQGHPGNYNPMWDGMTRGINVMKGEAHVAADLTCTVDGDRVEADLIVSTLPLSDDLEFINTLMGFVAVKSEPFVMPACFTTFPNHYRFVRVVEYKQQFFVESEYTLLSFDFPWKGRCPLDACMAEMRDFCRTVLKKEPVAHWYENRERVYPLSTRANTRLFEAKLEQCRHTPLVPIGRAGMHAYCSKDTVVRMGMETAQYLDELQNPETKVARLYEMRKELH